MTAAWQIRRATAGDAPAIIALFDTLGVPDQRPDAAHVEQYMMPRAIVACAGGDDRAIGYCTWRVYGRTGHVVQIAVDEAVRGRGAGRALLDGVRRELIAEGCAHWYLNVKRDNATARRLYERSGLAIEREAWSLKLAWERVDAIPGEPGTTAEPCGAAEEAELAARFGLLADRLAAMRARAAMRTIALRDAAGELAGYAAFAPRHPGAALFCVTRPALARPLFEACRPHAMPEHAYLYVNIDHDPVLARALIEAGAELEYELLQLGAPL